MKSHWLPTFKVAEFIKQSILLLCCALIIVHCNIIRNEDICGHHNGRCLYVELGEQGVLYANNISLIKNSLRSQSATELRQYMVNNSYTQCSLELVTCPSCAIVVTFKSINLPRDSCSDIGIAMDSPCR